MPRPSHRSRTRRRIYVKTPSGKNVIHYKERRPQAAHCANCKKVLPGVPRLRPLQLQKVPRSARRPQRSFGGVLCSACTRLKIKGLHQVKK